MNNGPLITIIFYNIISLYLSISIYPSSIYSYSSLISHVFIPPLSGIVPGRQNTVMRRHCAPEGVALHGAHRRRMTVFCLPTADLPIRIGFMKG
jgi:hypothetical protein